MLDTETLFIPLAWHGQCEIRAMRGHHDLDAVIASIGEAFDQTDIDENAVIDHVWATWQLPTIDDSDVEPEDQMSPILVWRFTQPAVEHSDGWFALTLIRSVL